MRSFLLLFCALGLARADWTPTAGLMGPKAHGLFLQGDTLFAGTAGGLYQSRDDGDHWTYSGLTQTAHVLVAQGNAKLAGTDKGVFRRKEGEASWLPAHAGLGDTEGVALAAMGPWAIAGNRNGIFRSIDQGSTWTPHISGLFDLHVTSLHVHGGTLYAGTQAGRVFRSADSGATWATVGPAPSHVLSVRRLGDRLFIRSRYGIHELSEDASAWDLRFEETRGAVGGTLFEVDGAVMYAMGSHGLHRSIDSGATWSRVSASLGTGCEPSRMVRKGSLLFAATELGMFRSADEGRTWAGIHRGMAVQVHGMPVSMGSRLLVGTEKGLFSTADDGETWARMDSGDMAPDYQPPRFHAIAQGDGALWACYTQGGLQGTMAMSLDSGRSWTPRPITLASYDIWARIEMISVQGGTVFASRDINGQDPQSHRFYRSRDRGLTWEESGAGLPKAYMTDMVSMGDTLFLGTWKGVHRSVDGGSQWTPTGSMDEESGVNSLAKLGNLLFAATNKGLYRSGDRGMAWTRIGEGGIRDSVLYSVIAAGGRLYVAGWATGVHMSADSGATWSRLDSPQEARGFQSAFYLLAAHGAHLYATGKGVWRMPLPQGPTQVTPRSARSGSGSAGRPIRTQGATLRWTVPNRSGRGPVDAGGRRASAGSASAVPAPRAGERP